MHLDDYMISYQNTEANRSLVKKQLINHSKRKSFVNGDLRMILANKKTHSMFPLKASSKTKC